jgi:hypothetical protein
MQDQLFSELHARVNGEDEGSCEALVLLGCGEPLDDWVTGVTKLLHDEGISTSADPEVVWESTNKLTTSGGRVDIALWFSREETLNIGKLAMWRLRFGDCSWASDYAVNYASHHEEVAS